MKFEKQVVFITKIDERKAKATGNTYHVVNILDTDSGQTIQGYINKENITNVLKNAIEMAENIVDLEFNGRSLVLLNVCK